MKNTPEWLVDELIQATYDTGYYSGKHEDGQPHHLESIERRRKAKERVLAALRKAQEVTA